jgi:predicted MFS family arabinose efflux permease
MRRPFLLFYALVFLDEVALLSIVPLVPAYTRAYHLSAVRAGALLSAASLAIVVASVPAGRLSDRFGARIVTLAASGIAAAAMLASAAAPSFGALLAARLAFGIGSGTIWSAGVSWLSDSADDDVRDRTLALVVTTAGVGSTIGPVFAGVLADHVARGAVFAVAGVPMVAVIGALAVSDPGTRRRHGHKPLGEVAAGMRSSPLLAGAVAIMLLGGVGDGVVNLVAPLQLGDLGLSSGAIGAWLSAASMIFIASSLAVARAGRRAVSLRLGGLMAALQAAALIPVLVSGAVPPVVATVLIRSVVVGPPYAMAFPLGALGAARLGVGTGTVNGVMGVVWGTANFVGPLAAGAVIAGPGDRAAYALLAVWCLLIALVLVRAGRREALLAAPAAAVPADPR